MARTLLPFRGHIFFLFPAFAFLLVLPGIVCGAGGNDLTTTALMARNFSEVFWSGEVLPRWLPEMFAGHGSPAFFLYPPLAFYFAALFYPLSRLDFFSYAPLLGAMFLALTLSGFTCYAWLRTHATPRISLLLSLLYMATPFHVAHGFYFTTLLAQSVAYSWFPLILFFTDRLARGARGGILGTAFSFALLVLTNIPMTIVFAPVAIFSALLLADKGRGVRVWWQLALALFATACLTAFYWMPALFYQPFTLIDSQWSHGKTFADRFFRFDLSPAKRTETFAYGGTLISVTLISALVGWMAFRAAPSRSLERYKVTLWMIAIGLALFLNFPASRWIWEAIPVLPVIQIPGRYLAIPSVGTIWLCAFLAARRPSRALHFCLYGFLAACVFLTTLFAYTQATSSHGLQLRSRSLYDSFLLQIDPYLTYLPGADVVARFYTPESVHRLQEHNPDVEVLRGDAKVSVVAWRSRHLLLDVTAAGASEIAIRQFYFPGWVAESGDVTLPLAREASTGRLLLSVPEHFGTQRISLTLAPLFPESFGILVSIVTLALCLWSTLRVWRPSQVHSYSFDMRQ